MASKSVKALKNSGKYEINWCICLVVTYLKWSIWVCMVDFSSDGINYSASLLHCKKGIIITTGSLSFQIQMSEHNSLPCGELHDNLFLILSQLSSH